MTTDFLVCWGQCFFPRPVYRFCVFSPSVLPRFLCEGGLIFNCFSSVPCFPVFVSSPPGFAWRPKFVRLRALSAQGLRGFACCGVGRLARFCLAIFFFFLFPPEAGQSAGWCPRGRQQAGQVGRKAGSCKAADERVGEPCVRWAGCWLLAAG